jgi:hypothetical protein
VFEQQLRAERLFLGENCRLKLLNRSELVGRFEPKEEQYYTMKRLTSGLLLLVIWMLIGIKRVIACMSHAIQHPIVATASLKLTFKDLCNQVAAWRWQCGFSFCDVLLVLIVLVCRGVGHIVWLAAGAVAIALRVAWLPVQIMAIVGQIAASMLQTNSYNSKENRDCFCKSSKDGKWLIVV